MESIVNRPTLRIAFIGAATACAMLSPVLAQAEESAFVTAVVRTSPIDYFRLETPTGDSQTGSQGYSFRGGVGIRAPGVDPASKHNSYARLNGRDGFIDTTQRGGIGRAGSIMAWVNLDKMPSQAGRIFYVAGISQSGNDFDVQFETDNALHFYTAAGSNVRFSPPAGSLLGQWHMIVATFDSDRRTRALYWDGRMVANDSDPGQRGKINSFTIGASPVWGNRFFDGGIDEVALWSKSLGAEQVANLYAAATAGAPAATFAAVPSSASAAGGLTTAAIVEVEDASGPIVLKPEEKIAMMFLSAIQSIELDCQMRAGAACTMEQMVAGPKSLDNSHINRLKYDPAADPNYAYVVKVNGKSWEARADPKSPGLGGFYFITKFVSPDAYYNANGAAGPMDRQLTSRGISGDSFSTR